jgi:polysaccharide pyruvyl transferase WcaK-like protein
VLIEIKGVQFVNKGAALMLRAVVDRLRATVPGVEFAVTPGPNAPYQRIAELGAWQRLRLPGAPVDVDTLSYRLPQRLRLVARRYGVVTEADLDAVLDASGFAYGDAWGDAPLESAAREIERLAARSKPYVFLPQAFGPFADTAASRRLGQALSKAALVCAREPESRDHLNRLAGRPLANLEVFPDFTLTVPGQPDAATRWGVDRGTALLIPNDHMRGPLNPDPAWRSGYLALMAAVAARLAERGFSVRVLNHEGRADAAACADLRAATDSLPVIDEDDPLALKGIIGAAGLTVCSRYHGCASSMSQGVPCLGTAWSHKYQALFDEFGQPGNLLTRCDAAAATAALDRLLSDLDGARARLAERRPALEARVEAMWTRVLAVLSR